MTVPALLPRPRLLDSCPARLGCNFPSQRPIPSDPFGAVPLAQDLGSQERFPPGPRALPARLPPLPLLFLPGLPRSVSPPRLVPPPSSLDTTPPAPPHLWASSSLLSPCLRTPTSCSPWGPSANHCASPVHACGPARPLPSLRPAIHHKLQQEYSLLPAESAQSCGRPGCHLRTEASEPQVRAEQSLGAIRLSLSPLRFTAEAPKPERGSDSPAVIRTSQCPRWLLHSPPGAPSAQPVHSLPLASSPGLWFRPAVALVSGDEHLAVAWPGRAAALTSTMAGLLLLSL